MFKLIRDNSPFILLGLDQSFLVIKILSKRIHELVGFKVVVITTYEKIFILHIILYFRQCLRKHLFYNILKNKLILKTFVFIMCKQNI